MDMDSRDAHPDPQIRPIADCVAGVDAALIASSANEDLTELRFALARCMHIHRAAVDQIDEGTDPSWLVASGLLLSWPHDAETGFDGLPRHGEDVYAVAWTVLDQSGPSRTALLAQALTVHTDLATLARQDDLAAMVALDFVEALLCADQADLL
jgi:hypothetical protein